MEKSCSFVGVGGISCGESRGLQEISCLFDCKEDMSGQLSNCHLSKSNLRENELIAIRAGMFRLTEDQFKMRRKKNNLWFLFPTDPIFFCRPYYFFNAIDHTTLFSLGGCGLLPKWRLLSH
jgi:hypothetical protein